MGTVPLQPSDGDGINHTHTDSWAAAIKELKGARVNISAVASATVTTPTTSGASPALWITQAATVAIPAWATFAEYTYLIPNISQTGTASINATAQCRLGTVQGASHRLPISVVAAVALMHGYCDILNVSSIAGSSVTATIWASWVAGAAVAYTTDAMHSSGTIVFT